MTLRTSRNDDVYPSESDVPVALRDAVARGLRPVLFHFDETRSFPGVTDGTRWNGFINVRVLPETLAEIQTHFVNLYRDDSDDPDNWPPVGEDGLVDLSGGFATIETEDEVDLAVEEADQAERDALVEAFVAEGDRDPDSVASKVHAEIERRRVGVLFDRIDDEADRNGGDWSAAIETETRKANERGSFVADHPEYAHPIREDEIVDFDDDSFLPGW